MNIEQHVKLIGILWIILGALSLCVGFFAVLIFVGVSLIPDIGDIAPGVLQIIAIAAGSFFAVLGLPKIIAGIGLMKRREWARILTLILAFLSLINVPFGTALGIYSILILFKPEAVKYFSPQAVAYSPPKA